jgi:hypothetical protein
MVFSYTQGVASDEPTEKTQKTQPRPRKKGKKMPEPIEIPIPTESQIARDFTKIAAPKHDEEDVDDG